MDRCLHTNSTYKCHIYIIRSRYLVYYNESQGELGSSYVNMNLARLLVRLLSPYTYARQDGSGGLPLNFLENALG